MSAIRERGRQVVMVKLKDYKTYRVKTERIHRLPEETLPDAVRESVRELKESVGRPFDFPSLISFYTGMAEITFGQWGNHIPMLFLFGQNWEIMDMITPEFEDQSDKYFFWRSLAERVQAQNIHCLISIAETWIRDPSKYPISAIKDLPIRGEMLQLAAFDRDGNKTVCSWLIERAQGSDLAALGPMEVADVNDQRVFFLVPAMRSMRIEPDFIPKQRAKTANNAAQSDAAKLRGWP